MLKKNKNINIMYKETFWASAENNEQLEKTSNFDLIIEDFMKIVPNEEERKQLLNDFKMLDKERKQEIQNFYKNEVKPQMEKLKKDILNTEFHKKVQEKMKELFDKIKNLNEKKDKKPEDEKNIRTKLAQIGLLNKSLKYNNLD